MPWNRSGVNLSDLREAPTCDSASRTAKKSILKSGGSSRFFMGTKMTIDSKIAQVILPVSSERLSSRTAARILVLTLTILCSLCPVSAQDEHKRKVPGLEKISPGFSHQAFSGRVLSVDIRQSLLNVNAVRGSGTEIFPFKKSVRVEAANGDRLKVEELQPGTNVIVYYDQRGEQRTVKDIVVLQAAPAKEPAKEKDSKPGPAS